MEAPKPDYSDNFLRPNRGPFIGAGSKLGDTTLTCLVERGFLGDVWLGHQANMDREVMVKIFHPGIGEELSDLYAPNRRIQSLAKLDHPSLSALYRSGSIESRAYVIYERSFGIRLDRLLHGIFGHNSISDWDGPTLSSKTGISELIPALLCQAGGWQCRVAQWGASLAEAIQHAHQSGIYHRAIWSGNIMIDKHGEARLFDYWYASELNPNQVPKMLPFLAPEEVELREGQYFVGDHRADIFSLGVVLYSCLVGHTPYPIVQAPAGEMVLFDRKPPSVRNNHPEISRRLDHCLMKALAIDPRERWRSAQEMSEALGDFSDYIKSRSAKSFQSIRKPLHRLFQLFARSSK